MRKKHILLLVVALLLLLPLTATLVLRNQRIRTPEAQTIYVPHGSSYQDLVDSLQVHGCIQNAALFHQLATLRGLPKHMHAGCYRLQPGMGVVAVIQKFYRGSQDPVRLTIGKQRTKENLCQTLSKKLELQADSLLILLNDSNVTRTYGHTPESIIGMFCQNTYEVYWTIPPISLLDRMKKESDRFWNQVRKGQCADLKLSPNEVLTIASIVEEETNQNDEKALIASVYLNRLHRGMPLQADPTVRYACGNFAARRIGGNMLAVESPYNTYKHAGLPPGPICIPGRASIEAVLSGVTSPYLYFCAKEDFSGHHNFAATLEQHQQNARRYHQALNRRGIK